MRACYEPQNLHRSVGLLMAGPVLRERRSWRGGSPCVGETSTEVFRMSGLVRLTLFAVRVLAGTIFLRSGLEKLRGGWIATQGLDRFVRASLSEGRMSQLLRGFLEHTVLPHSNFFAHL